MKIKVIASTKQGYVMPKEEALNFSGKSAGICYLPSTAESLFSEPEEKTRKRADRTVQSGHHSVFGHPTYNIILEGIPKILAMILNNEKMYNTSEKSARYTKMEALSKEKDLYEKWIHIFKKQISAKYPQLEGRYVEKLAQENARYLISIFAPSTIMEYTTNFAQLNYILNWAKDYINGADNTAFSIRLKKVLKEFINAFPDLEVEGLDSRAKGRKFSLFAERKNRQEEFGENYSINYLASFAELAQAQRHRTLAYEMYLLDKPQYYIPPIIEQTEYEKQWLEDISSLEEGFPQGMLVHINERGTIENFVLKCTERLCGVAQLEIMENTKKTMDRYKESVKDNSNLYNYLLPYSKGARCTFPGFKCNVPCAFGGKSALERII